LRRQKKQHKREPRIRTNEQIRAAELRVIGVDGVNLGVLSLADALKAAREADLDLIEVSPKAKPPIAKIMDYGKYLYDEKKKAKETKAKATTVEVKTVQVKIGTSENDLSMKAKRVSKWLNEGDRVKIDLFLPGRTKYMKKEFLEERIQRILRLISVEYKVADSPKKSPKGMTLIVERVK
jgi:translation initiation factor IF-3